MLTASLVDPRAEPVAPAWEALLAAEAIPAPWHAAALRALAWNARSPTYLGLVCDGGGTPYAIFFLRHLGVASCRPAFVQDDRPPAVGILECRLGPSATGRGYRFAAALDIRERRAALSALERAVRKRLGPRAAAIAYRDVTPGDLPAFSGSRRLLRRVAPEVVIANRWDDIDAYFAELDPKRRSQLRRLEAQLARDERLVVSDERALDPVVASRLATSVACRHRRGRRGAPIPAGYFDALGGGPGVTFLSYREGGRLLSFATLVDDGVSLADSVWGNLDVRDGGRRDLYFHHYVRAIAHLIARRRDTLALGKGLGEIKLRYGGRYEDRFVAAAIL